MLYYACVYIYTSLSAYAHMVQSVIFIPQFVIVVLDTVITSFGVQKHDSKQYISDCFENRQQ